MKKLLLQLKVMSILLFMVSCGKLTDKLWETPDVKNCTTSSNEAGVSIICPDGSVSFLPYAQNNICAAHPIEDGLVIQCDSGFKTEIKNGVSGQNGKSCKTESTSGGAVITCEDGSQTILYNGSDGESIKGDSLVCETVDVDDGVQMTCSDGNSFVIKHGRNGIDAISYPPPTNGLDGYSSVFKVISATQCPTGGSTIFLATDTNRNNELDLNDLNITSTTLCNGLVGASGEVGPAGQPGVSPNFTPITIIDPCGDKSGLLDEVLLKLSDGTIIASVSDKANGENTRFSIIIPGSYITTDGSKCFFTVDTSGNITNEHY